MLEPFDSLPAANSSTDFSNLDLLTLISTPFGRAFFHSTLILQIHTWASTFVFSGTNPSLQ
jgi:hypothetical protein